MRRGDLESIFGRLQELVLANSGEDEFEEIFKLLVAKLLDEMRHDTPPRFRVLPNPRETARSVNALLAEAGDRWKGILPPAPTIRLTDQHLSVCVEALAQQALLDSRLEALDAAFEYLVSSAAKGQKGQFFTPRYVIECCVQMVNPRVDEFVLDPACGSAGFLIHSLAHIRCNGAAAGTPQTQGSNLWGFDLDQRAIRVAKALMLLASGEASTLIRLNSLLTPSANLTLFDSEIGDSMPRLTIEDVLRTHPRRQPAFDVILTNPPFAGEIREPHLLASYELHRAGRRMERDMLFLERCVRMLRPGGRLAIVLPHNKFASASWSYAREWLLRELRVVAVLGLGRNTFLPHTHQKASVLFGFKRDRRIQRATREPILFMISEKDGKDSTGQVIPRAGVATDDPAWVRADHDLSDLVPVFRQFVTSAGIDWPV